MEKSTSVSIRANAPYIKALRELARHRKTTVADLVRESLDQAHGNELSQLSSFFEEVVNEVGRLSEKMDGRHDS